MNLEKLANQLKKSRIAITEAIDEIDNDTTLIHISDFVDNETFEIFLNLIGLTRDEENDYRYIKVKLIEGVK